MEDQQKALIEELRGILKKYDNYQDPYARADGGILIPIDPVLRRNQEAHQRFADAFSEMMSKDMKPRRSSTWVE